MGSGSVEVDGGNGTYVNVINDLTLNTDVSVPAGVALIVKSGNTLKVDTGVTLDLTGGGLVLADNATLTVDGTVNAKGSTGPASFGIVLMPGSTTVEINGSGEIHLKTRGTLLAVMAGQKLTLDGTITLDGLRTTADGGTDGDNVNNVGQVIFVSGELDMRGGKVTGNYNTADYDGGGVEVNQEDGGAAIFTMSGSAEVSGNRTLNGGAGVNVVHGATFIMKGSAKISDNTADGGGGGVRINKGSRPNDTTFTMEGNAEISGNSAGTYGGGVWVRDGGDFILKGGTVYGSGEATGANTASSGGASLYVSSDYSLTGTAKWGGTSSNISGGDGGTSAGGNILSGAGGADDTLTAVGP
jgi:hypothetical protein